MRVLPVSRPLPWVPNRPERRRWTKRNGIYRPELGVTFGSLIRFESSSNTSDPYTTANFTVSNQTVILLLGGHSITAVPSVSQCQLDGTTNADAQIQTATEQAISSTGYIWKNVTAGTHNIKLTGIGSGFSISVHVFDASGVDQTTGYQHATNVTSTGDSSGSVSLSVASATGNMCVGMANGGNTNLLTAGGTIIKDDQSITNFTFQSERYAGAASVSVGYTWSGTVDYAFIAFDLIAAASASGASIAWVK